MVYTMTHTAYLIDTQYPFQEPRRNQRASIGTNTCLSNLNLSVYTVISLQSPFLNAENVAGSKLMLIDTHCHLNMVIKTAFDRALTAAELLAIDAIIAEAAQQNVRTIINVGTSVIESSNCVRIAQQYPSTYATVGIHPNDLTADWREHFKEIKKLAAEPGVVGIGEIGMDYHYSDYDKQRQFDAFRAQIELALERDKAVVVHSRDAIDDTLKVLQEYQHQLKRCVVHCFSENADVAQQVASWGYFIGIGGTITYPKNNFLREAVLAVGIQSIVLETDAPFLPPQSQRGKQNCPANIALVAQYLSELLPLPPTMVAEQTSANARFLFGL